jgi:predicted metal-dependent HD superfamily phosphohydrolase
VSELANRWQRTWAHLEASAPAGLFEKLAAAYDEPHRAYHTRAHLRDCFRMLDSSRIEPEDRPALELALWFHDAIYDTKASDNEARSADWAVAELSSLGDAPRERIRGLILATQHDAAPESPDQELLLDVDLSILGAAEARFDAYEQAVRREFAWVPEAAYRAGRTRILAQFEERPVLFHTAHFRELLEAQARSNLRRSLTALGAAS